MKSIVLISAFIFATQAQAVSWKVFGPCSEQPVYSGNDNVDITESVGKISQSLFDQYKVSYIGTDAGFNSIINTPTGLDAMEVISDTKMRAYGWCFSVNGKIPTEMPDQINVSDQNAQIVWFYGYSTNDHDKWTDYCVPGYRIKAKQFCSK